MRFYGKWAGNPSGTKEDPSKCVVEVYRGIRFYQCARKRGYGPNGMYCKQHAKRLEKRCAILKISSAICCLTVPRDEEE